MREVKSSVQEKGKGWWRSEIVEGRGPTRRSCKVYRKNHVKRGSVL